MAQRGKGPTRQEGGKAPDVVRRKPAASSRRREGPDGGGTLAQLSRHAGNQAAGRWLQRRANLTVNAPGDRFEREAEVVASRVVAGAPTAAGPVSPTGPTPPTVRRQPVGAQPAAPSSPAAAVIARPDPGRPVAPETRRRVEPHVGADLSGARLHDDPAARLAADSLSARAFTVGPDIFLGSEGSAGDTRLMAHELTHVAQQGAAAGAAGAVVAATPAIQRDIFDDAGAALGSAWEATGGAAIEAGTEFVEDVGESIVDFAWSILEEYAPDLADLLREILAQGGIVDYLKSLLSGALDALFEGVGADSGVLGGFLQTFTTLLGTATEILGPLAAGDCQPLFDAVGRLQEAVTQMAGEAWDAIVEFFTPVGEFFSDLWTRFGAPVVDWISEVAGDIWQGIQDIATDIWDWTAPIRDAFARAWQWVKDQLGIGASEDSEGGLIQWVQEKAAAAWDAIMEVLEPIIAPIREVADQIAAVLPLDAILNLRETIQGWLENAGSMVDSMEQPDGVTAQQTSLRDEILPAVLQTVESVRESLVGAGSWIASVIGALVERVAGFMETLRGNSLIGGVASALQWVADGVASLGAWAQETVVGLISAVGDGLVYLASFIRPILDVLQQLVDVVSDVMGNLADLVTGVVFQIIPECIVTPIKDFILEHILSHIPLFDQLRQLPDIWGRVAETAMTILRQIFVDGNLFAAAWTFFSALLNLVGIPPQLVTNILRNAINAFSDILADPVAFILNLLSAVKEGFVRFFANVGTHLLNGVVGWLTGQLSEAGISPPTEFSLSGILGFVFEVLGVTVDNIFERLARHPRIGPERAAQLRRALDIAQTVWGWIVTLVTEGPAGIWRQLMEQLSNLWTMVLTSVIGWITNSIITTATTRLLSMLDPSGIMAVVNSLIALYRAIESFMQYLREMLEVVNSVLEGIAGIARGAIDQAAAFLEGSLVRILPIAIGFLANQVGLGGLGRRVGEMIEGVRERVNGAIDWLIDRAVRGGEAILNALGLGDRRSEEAPPEPAPGAAAAGEYDGELGKVVSYTAAGEQHRLWIVRQGNAAVVMIASEQMTVPQALDLYSQMAGQLADEERRATVQGLISQARTLHGTLDSEADGLAAQTQQAEPNAESVATADNAVESAEDRLAALMRQIQEALGITQSGAATAGPAAAVAALYRRLTGRQLNTIAELRAAMVEIHNAHREGGVTGMTVNVPDPTTMAVNITVNGAEPARLTVPWAEMFADVSASVRDTFRSQPRNETNAAMSVNGRLFGEVSASNSAGHAEENLLSRYWEEALAVARERATAGQDTTIGVAINRAPCHNVCTPLLTRAGMQVSGDPLLARHVHLILAPTGVYEPTERLSQEAIDAQEADIRARAALVNRSANAMIREELARVRFTDDTTRGSDLATLSGAGWDVRQLMARAPSQTTAAGDILGEASYRLAVEAGRIVI